MSYSASMTFEVQTGGSDTLNSGGFKGGGYIAAPSAPTVTPSASGGTVAAATYYVVVTYTDGLGETVISGQTAVTVSGATASFTTTSPPASTGALTWSHYCATVSGGPYFPQGTALVIGSNRTVTTTPPTSGTQPRGVDYSLATTRQLIIDNSTVTATTAGANSNVITFSGYAPTGADVGNTARITGGTNINTGVVEITAITPTTWTVQALSGNLTTAGGAGSAITGGMGGCFASPGQAGGLVTNTFGMYVKAGTYTIGNGTVNTAGNKISVVVANIIGYSTNRHPDNTDTAPVFNAGGASFTVFSMGGNGTLAHNLSITNSGANASVVGWSPSNATGMARRISVTGCAQSMAAGMSDGIVIDCSDSGCGGMGAAGNGCSFIRYVSLSGTGGNAISMGAGCTVRESLVSGQAGTSSVGIKVGNNCLLSNCIADLNAGSSTNGIHLNGTGCTAEDCIATRYSGTSAIGFNQTANAGNVWRNCADYGNTTAYATSILAYQKTNCVTLTGDPFVNAAGLDFSLNGTAGAGAACRQAGIPGAFFGLSTTGYRSIGIAEPAAAGGGGPVIGCGFIRGLGAIA